MVETTDDGRKRQELQDHGHELAGLDTGRMSRFGVGAAREQEIRDQKQKERAYRDALDRLLATDPEYRRLYEELGEGLRAAETDANNTIEAIQRELAAVQEANAEMRDNAPKVDGKALFRYADGRVVDEDGRDIAADIAATIVWPENTTSAEDYFASIAREAELRDTLEDWQIYRHDTLGGIRDRYDDRDNPMTKDEMREALEEIERLQPPPVADLISGDPAEQPEVALNNGAFPTFGN